MKFINLTKEDIAIRHGGLFTATNVKPSFVFVKPNEIVEMEDEKGRRAGLTPYMEMSKALDVVKTAPVESVESFLIRNYSYDKDTAKIIGDKFKTIDELRNATVEDLEALPKIGAKRARILLNSIKV